MSHDDLIPTIVTIYAALVIVGIIFGIYIAVDEDEPEALIIIPLSIIWPITLFALGIFYLTRDILIPLYYKRGKLKRIIKAFYWEYRAKREEDDYDARKRTDRNIS